MLAHSILPFLSFLCRRRFHFLNFFGIPAGHRMPPDLSPKAIHFFYFAAFNTVPLQWLHCKNCKKIQHEMLQSKVICSFYKNRPSPASFSFRYVRIFKQTLQFLHQINVKNVHPVYGAGIQIHNLWNMSIIP